MLGPDLKYRAPNAPEQKLASTAPAGVVNNPGAEGRESRGRRRNNTHRISDLSLRELYPRLWIAK